MKTNAGVRWLSRRVALPRGGWRRQGSRYQVLSGLRTRSNTRHGLFPLVDNIPWGFSHLRVKLPSKSALSVRFLSRMSLQMSLEIALLDSHHVRNFKEIGGYLNGYLKIIFARSPQLCNLYPRLTESGKHTSASMFDFMVKVGFCGQCFFCGNFNFQRILSSWSDLQSRRSHWERTTWKCSQRTAWKRTTTTWVRREVHKPSYGICTLEGVSQLSHPQSRRIP